MTNKELGCTEFVRICYSCVLFPIIDASHLYRKAAFLSHSLPRLTHSHNYTVTPSV